MARRKGRAHSTKQVFPEFSECLLGSGNHLRHQQASQDSVFFRYVSLNRQTCTFLTAHADLVLGQEFREIFEPDGGLPDAQSVLAGHAIDEMRGGDGSSHVSGPTSGRRQIINE